MGRLARKQTLPTFTYRQLHSHGQSIDYSLDQYCIASTGDQQLLATSQSLTGHPTLELSPFPETFACSNNTCQ